ncbi:MAG: hypothetical protein N2689_09420, partial [Verrucomicrobiae bacterium]|nr:hypothetical protein [Verrucomicrobiae bacterium]
MISPVDGSTLTSGTVTFTWDTGVGVTQYALWIGNNPNGYDLFSGYVTGQSKTVSLPVDGRTIYVTLWSLINGAWQSNAYIFTAYTAPAPTKAVMVSPSPGSTLTSATTIFTWNGPGVSQFALWVGSAPNTYDLHASVETGQSKV